MVFDKDLKTDGERIEELNSKKTEQFSLKTGRAQTFIHLLVLACGILVPDQGLNPSPTVNALSPNHWTTRIAMSRHFTEEKIQMDDKHMKRC